MQYMHNELRDDITGVLLAGGRSRRMGFDKARIEVNGKTLFAHSLDLLRRHFATVLIAGDRPDLAALGLPVLQDLYPGSALGGLYTALKAARTDWIFVAPCDMPYPDDRILALLLKRRGDCDAVVPRTPEGYEPVFALYHKRCLPRMEEMLNRQEFRIYDFYLRIQVDFLDWQMMPDGWQRSLLNINTPEQLIRVREEEKMTPPVVSIVARSGTGKTTLLEKMIAELKSRGYRVAAIKHDAHRFDIDHQGKDSWRLTRAGADVTLLCSAEKLAMVRQHPPEGEPDLAECVAAYCGDVDIILTEGFKKNAMPKIEVHRKACGDPLLCRDTGYDPALIAIAADAPLQADVPCYDLDDACGLCDLLVARYLS